MSRATVASRKTDRQRQRHQRGARLHRQTEQQQRQRLAKRFEADPVESFAEAERQTVLEILGEGRTPQKAAEVGANASNWVSNLSNEVLEHDPRQLACRAGCAWCCYVTAWVTVPEVLSIVDYIHASFTDAEIEDLRQRAELAAQRMLEVTDERQRLAARLACPLLGTDNRCTVYPARPTVCAAFHSFDVEPCKAEYEEPDVLHAAPVNPMPLAIGHGTREGILRGTRQAGLPSYTVELIAALHIALETPDAAAQWLAGEPLFEPARVPPALLMATQQQVEALAIGGLA